MPQMRQQQCQYSALHFRNLPWRGQRVSRQDFVQWRRRRLVLWRRLRLPLNTASVALLFDSVRVQFSRNRLIPEEASIAGVA